MTRLAMVWIWPVLEGQEGQLEAIAETRSERLERAVGTEVLGGESGTRARTAIGAGCRLVGAGWSVFGDRVAGGDGVGAGGDGVSPPAA